MSLKKNKNKNLTDGICTFFIMHETVTFSAIELPTNQIECLISRFSSQCGSQTSLAELIYCAYPQRRCSLT